MFRVVAYTYREFSRMQNQFPLLLAVVALLVDIYRPFVVRAEEPRRIQTAITSVDVTYTNFYVAERQGFFKEQNIFNELVVMRSAARQIQALVAGSVEVSVQAPDPLVRAVEKGADLVMLSGVVNAPTYDLVAGKKYRSIEELRGTTLGVSGINSSSTLLLQEMLSAHGLSYPRDYNLIEVGGTNLRWAAIQSGVVSAGILTPPFSYLAAEQSFSMLGDLREYVPEVQFAAVSVRRPWAHQNPRLVEDYLAALLKANRYIYENKPGTLAVIRNTFKVKPEYAERVYEYWVNNRVTPIDGAMTVKGTEVVLNILERLGDFKGKARPKAEKYIDSDFIAQARSRPSQ